MSCFILAAGTNGFSSRSLGAAERLLLQSTTLASAPDGKAMKRIITQEESLRARHAHRPVTAKYAWSMHTKAMLLIKVGAR